jgi:hypothetical protein
MSDLPEGENKHGMPSPFYAMAESAGLANEVESTEM